MPALTPGFNWILKNKLDKCDPNFYMIGRLSELNSIRPSTSAVRFFIDPISPEPLPVLESREFENVGRNYIGMDTRQDPDYLPDYYDTNGNDMEERADELQEFYSDKLFIFHPSYNQTKDGKIYKNLMICALLEDPGEIEAARYETLPEVHMDPLKFEELLQSGDYFELPRYDNELYDIPNVILCGNYAYRLKENPDASPLVTSSESRHMAWKCADPDNVVRIDLGRLNYVPTAIITASDSISFMETALYSTILLTSAYDPLGTPLEEEPVIPECEEAAEEEIIEDVEEETYDQAQERDLSEVNFIKGLQALTIRQKLIYRYEDLVNFHTSVKTNPLTILSGMSGTGKTQLAYNYARMLDLSEDNNTLLFMPISPAYTEPGDVLGYLNPMNNRYVPAESGLVDFLVHADKNKNKMHMVIFDEMNLSQVEYWFSPFLSVLEKDIDDRYLKLYDDAAVCENQDKYPARIKIDENVLFVGTVNIDETTKDFSDRLLDRTFVISLQKITFRELYQNLHVDKQEVIDFNQAKCENASVFLGWNRRQSEHNDLSAFKGHEEELQFLDEFDELFKKYLPNGRISYRVLRNINNFILNIPETPEGERMLERGKALDTILNQTVIQKIRGTESQLQAFIGVAGSEYDPVEKSALMSLLERYSTISDFAAVKENIRRKAEDLRVNGYTN